MIRKLKKKHSTITTRDLYIHYLENQDKHEFTLDYEKWKKVMYSLFYKLSKSVIEANLVYKFESGLGIYGIEKVKGKEKRRIDFNQTRKLGRTVYHGNLHTDCYYFRFVWRKKRTAFHMNPHIRYYRFLTSLDMDRNEIGKRGLAKWVKDCSKDPLRKDYDAPFKIL